MCHKSNATDCNIRSFSSTDGHNADNNEHSSGDNDDDNNGDNADDAAANADAAAGDDEQFVFVDQFGHRYEGLTAGELRALEKHRLEYSYGTYSLLLHLRATVEARRRQRAAVRAAREAAAAAAAAATESGSGFAAPRRRRANDVYVFRGIADECCLRPCTVRTLLSYCRTPPKY